MKLGKCCGDIAAIGLLLVVASAPAQGASLSDLTKRGLATAAQGTGCGLIPFSDYK